MINPDAIRLEDCYQVKCRQCGKLFEAKRISAEFCGSACRGRHHRTKQRRQEAISRAKEALQIVVQNMPWRGESDEYVALQWCQTLILRGLSNVQEK